MMKITPQLEGLFSKPLPSTRSGAFYNTFPYPTKISPESIAIYIACMTQPGDTVLDAFAGSGSTGIAALLCEHPTAKMLAMAKELKLSPTWGKRNAVLYEIGTYASFATKTLTNRLTAIDYNRIVNDFISKAENLTKEMYVAIDPEGNVGMIRYVIWTEVLLCPNCSGEISYFESGTSKNPVSFNDSIMCPHCKKAYSVENMGFAKEDFFDKMLGKVISRKKRKIAWVYGSTNGVNWDRAGRIEDEQRIQSISDEFSPSDSAREISWGDLHRSGYHYGITHLHHFYTIRNYSVMSMLWKLADTYQEREGDAIKLLLLSYNSAHCTLMTRVVAKHNAKDFILTGAQSGVLYISKLPVEKNILLGLKRKAKPFMEAYKLLENCSGTIKVHNSSSAAMTEQDDSVDLVFTDPPFGDFIPYAEVNQINELWLPSVTERSKEVIISTSQQKDIGVYRDMLAGVFSELGRVCKNDCGIVVVFHAAKAAVWRAFSEAIQAAKLKIMFSSILDKAQSSFKQVVSRDSVQGDPLFLLKRCDQHKDARQSDIAILKQILEENPHESESDIRRCYSLYIGKCMEDGSVVNMDAKQVYNYIASFVEVQ